MFTSQNERIRGFLRMARLLDYLQSDATRSDKVFEIKRARDDGFISEDEALELTIEFC